jgi:hypothetical protein
MSNRSLVVIQAIHPEWILTSKSNYYLSYHIRLKRNHKRKIHILPMKYKWKLTNERLKITFGQAVCLLPQPPPDP